MSIVIKTAEEIAHMRVACRLAAEEAEEQDHTFGHDIQTAIVENAVVGEDGIVLGKGDENA